MLCELVFSKILQQRTNTFSRQVDSSKTDITIYFPELRSISIFKYSLEGLKVQVASSKKDITVGFFELKLLENSTAHPRREGSTWIKVFFQVLKKVFLIWLAYRFSLMLNGMNDKTFVFR